MNIDTSKLFIISVASRARLRSTLMDGNLALDMFVRSSLHLSSALMRAWRFWDIGNKRRNCGKARRLLKALVASKLLDDSAITEHFGSTSCAWSRWDAFQITATINKSYQKLDDRLWSDTVNQQIASSIIHFIFRCHILTTYLKQFATKILAHSVAVPL